jgi:hypothetical protein
VIEWIRGLPSSLRYLICVVGTLLMFFLAVGVGAMAALMLSQQPEQVTPSSGNSAESSTLEDTLLETTSITKKLLEDTRIETTNQTKKANPQKPAYEASFVHRATDKNSRGDYTYLNNPRINGDPKAIVLVRPTPDRGSTISATYKHNIGVWYESVAKKWAIFNQDRAAVPSGATFEVIVPPDSEKVVHHAELINIVGNRTYLDGPLTKGNPDLVLSVTQNWNPGGGRGVYNNHPIGVLYDKGEQKWAIYNRDDAPMPKGAAFNVALSGSVKSGR